MLSFTREMKNFQGKLKRVDVSRSLLLLGYDNDRRD